MRPFIIQALGADPFGTPWAEVEARGAADELLFFAIEFDGRLVAGFDVARQAWHGQPSLTVPHLGGEGLANWRDALLEFLDGLAAAVGAKAVALVGRTGWTRCLPGYRVEAVVMVKAVTDER